MTKKVKYKKDGTPDRRGGAKHKTSTSYIVKNTPKQLRDKCAKYFASTDKPSVSRLAVYLGYCHIRSLHDIMNKNKCKESAYIIKKAITTISSYHEERLYESGSTGSIFFLKCHGWNDSPSIEEAPKEDIHIKVFKK